MHSWCVHVAVSKYMWHCSQHNSGVIETIDMDYTCVGCIHQWLLPHLHSLDQCYPEQTKETTVIPNWWVIASCKVLERQASQLQLLDM